MSAFRFDGPVELYYPSLGVTAEPGDVHDFDEAPDGHWSPADTPAPEVPAATEES